MITIEVHVSDIRVGDEMSRVQGTSHVCNRHVRYAVVSVSAGSHPKNDSMRGVNLKLRDMRTGRCKNEFQADGRTLTVHRHDD